MRLQRGGGGFMGGRFVVVADATVVKVGARGMGWKRSGKALLLALNETSMTS